MLHIGLKKNFWLLAVIFAAAFLLYGNTIRNGYSLDDTYVAQNNSKVLKGIAGIPEILTSRYVDEEGNSFGYRPIAMATFAIEQELWGQNPHLGHMINTLLYALCSMLLFVVLRKIFKNAHPLFLLVVVLLFAAHPIHTEVVASLKNRETLLSFLFSILSLLFFLKWMDVRRAIFAITGVLIFVLAFLSKQDAMTFAAVIPLALLYSSPESKLFTKLFVWYRFVSKSPEIYISFAVLSFLIYFFTRHGQVGRLPALFSYFSTIAFLILYYRTLKNDKVAPVRNKSSYLFLVSGIILFPAAIYFSKSVLALISLICFAIFFTFFFENVKNRQISIPAAWLSLFITFVVLGIAGVVSYKLPDLYLPVENKIMYNFENPQFASDTHYSTIPLGFYTLFFYLQILVWPHPLGFYYGYKMIPEVSWTTPEVLLSFVFHFAILAFALWKLPKKHILSFAILYYLATISIFTNIVIKIPGIVGERLAFFPSLGFCIALAYGIFRLLKIDIRSEHIPKTKTIWLSGIMLVILIPYSIKTIVRNRDWKDYLTLYSHDIGYLSNSAKANNTYANQLLKEAFNNEVKNPDTAVQKEYLNLAIKHLQKTVEIDSTFKFAWNNLGFVTYLYLGKKEEGISYMQKAVQTDPNYGEALFNLGYFYKQQKNYEKSIQYFQDAQRINPRKIIYYTEEADAWLRSGNLESALKLYKKASGLDSTSDQPFIGMGNVFWLSGDTLKAIENWEKAFDLNPVNLDICNNLLGYYTNKGNPKAAWYRSKLLKLQQKNP